MEEVTSVAETPADCGIVLNCDEYFPQLNGTPIFVARSIAIIICYKTFGGSKLNFKVENFADLEKRFFVANVLIRTTTLPFWFVRSSVNFFLQRPPLARMHFFYARHRQYLLYSICACLFSNTLRISLSWASVLKYVQLQLY